MLSHSLSKVRAYVITTRAHAGHRGSKAVAKGRQYSECRHSDGPSSSFSSAPSIGVIIAFLILINYYFVTVAFFLASNHQAKSLSTMNDCHYACACVSVCDCGPAAAASGGVDDDDDDGEALAIADGLNNRTVLMTFVPKRLICATYSIGSPPPPPPRERAAYRWLMNTCE